MRRAIMVCLLLAPGCATSRGGDVDLMGLPQIRTVTAGALSPSGEDAGSTIRYVDDPVLVRDALPITGEEAWPLLLAAFRDEGLAPDQMDVEKRIISRSRFEWAHERDGVPLSTYLDCGPSPAGRPLADDARIVAAVAAQLRAQGEGATQVTIHFEGVAFPFESSGSPGRRCVTTGELERTLVGRIRSAADADTPTPATAGPAPPVPAPSPAGAFTPFEVPGGVLFAPGVQVRVWLSSSERLTGTFLGVRSDSLLLRKTRRVPVPLGAIRSMQVKRTRRAAILAGTALGVVTGIVVAVKTNAGIGGRHSIQGELLNPGLGALAGGLVGAVLSATVFGSSWVEVPLDPLFGN